MTDPESLDYMPVQASTLAAARAACASAVAKRAEERGREVEPWTALADAGISAPDTTGERWLRLLAGDSTTWFLASDDFAVEAVVAAAEEFGRMLADDILPLD